MNLIIERIKQEQIRRTQEEQRAKDRMVEQDYKEKVEEERRARAKMTPFAIIRDSFRQRRVDTLLMALVGVVFNAAGAILVTMGYYWLAAVALVFFFVILFRYGDKRSDRFQ